VRLGRLWWCRPRFERAVRLRRGGSARKTRFHRSGQHTSATATANSSLWRLASMSPPPLPPLGESGWRRFPASMPQFAPDGAFDPSAFRTYMERAEALGFESPWTQVQPGPGLRQRYAVLNQPLEPHVTSGRTLVLM